MNDDQYFLANAYLDGELTDEERRIAETDPEVMSEVEQLSALHAELRDVPAPTDEAREAAISAAMAEFDVSGATAQPATTPAVIPFRPRPAYARFLAVAAAIVAVAGLGIIVSQANLGGGDDDAADGASEATAETADAQRNAGLTESEDDADAGDAEAAGDAAATEMLASDDSAGSDTASEPAAPSDMAEGAADDMADEAAEDEDSAESTAEMSDGGTTYQGQLRKVPPDFDPSAPIIDDVELGIYGAYLVGERDAGRLPPTPNTPCAIDPGFEVLDETAFVIDGSLVPVYVAVWEVEGIVLALDTESCAELTMGTLYEG